MVFSLSFRAQALLTARSTAPSVTESSTLRTYSRSTRGRATQWQRQQRQRRQQSERRGHTLLEPALVPYRRLLITTSYQTPRLAAQARSSTRLKCSARHVPRVASRSRCADSIQSYLPHVELVARCKSFVRNR